jgi:hypothetical protein
MGVPSSSGKHFGKIQTSHFPSSPGSTAFSLLLGKWIAMLISKAENEAEVLFVFYQSR